MSWKFCNQLKHLRFYLDYCVLCGFATDVTSFNAQTMASWVAREDFLCQQVEYRLPAPCKLHVLERWQVWDVQFRTYLVQFRISRGGCPLTYDIWNEPINATAVYTNIEDHMINFSLHTTKHFLIDNRRTFDLLEALLVETVNNVYIQRLCASRVGSGSWLAPKLNAEGPERRRICQTVAQTAMDTTKYTGRGKSTIEAYINVHQQSHNEMAAIDQPVDEEVKVEKFLGGIVEENG
jgi:hypothetical protein